MGQGREKPGEAMPPNNSSHSKTLVAGLVTWHLQPEARPCDGVGSVLFRGLQVLEDGRIHVHHFRQGTML